MRISSMDRIDRRKFTPSYPHLSPGLSPELRKMLRVNTGTKVPYSSRRLSLLLNRPRIVTQTMSTATSSFKGILFWS